MQSPAVAQLVSTSLTLAIECDRLRLANAVLVASLQRIARQCSTYPDIKPAIDYATIGSIAREALAKAKGE